MGEITGGPGRSGDLQASPASRRAEGKARRFTGEPGKLTGGPRRLAVYRRSRNAGVICRRTWPCADLQATRAGPEAARAPAARRGWKQVDPLDLQATASDLQADPADHGC